uniref:Uncharacterized protein LOC117363173 isoform X2 n=1 Tax=Geotrypetes seraphini TaxID=260995 RepID=A0A6P8RM85_GEOSA|nr:uncharacterized protein LOC117363173 isoform X2 [Geotrypetes seraphini]
MVDTTSSSVTSENTDALMEDVHIQRDTLPASLEEWLKISEENISSELKGLSDRARSLETLTGSLGKTSFGYFRSKFGGSAESILSVASSDSLPAPEWKMLRVRQSQRAFAGTPSIDRESTWRTDAPKEGIIQDVVDDVVGDEINFRVPTHQGYNKSTIAVDYPETESRTAGHVEEINSPSSKCASSKNHTQTSLIHRTDSQQSLPKTCEAGQIHSSQNKSRSRGSSSNSGSSSTSESAAHRSACWPEKHGSEFSTLESNSSGKISSSSQMPEAEESQDVSLPLLKALLTEKEGKINLLSKELLNMQIENQQLLKEKLRLSEQSKLKKMEKTFEEELKNPAYGTLDPTSPTLLQQEIADLKSQISDLQEAKESAVLELAKANEEISQQKTNVAKLKAEYSRKLEDSKEEVNLLQEKIGRIESRFSSLKTPDPGLSKEISHLRSQSRQLREVNHQLNEKNHRLKEELWDLRRQWERLVRRPADRQNGDNREAFHRTDLGKTELSTKDQHRQNGLGTDGTNAFPQTADVTSVSGEVWRQPWMERPWEHRKGSTSPGSHSSGSTEFLLSRYQEDNTSNHNKVDGDCHEIQESSDNVLSSTCPGHSDARNDLVCYSATEKPSGLVLPKRPFAPRSVADLKLGNVVKFSRPAGKISKGRVKYVGHLFGREDVYVGVELEGSEMGKHDGTFEGIRHFVCKANKGVFVNFSKVIMAWE